MLALSTVVIFATGLFTGSMKPHQPEEAMRDLMAFILCRVTSPLLAFGAWGTGFAALLRRPHGPTWSAISVMLLILIFLALLCFSAWRGTAAFHPNPLNP
jgi:hypothetical protein